jgi:hypothetical protein
MTQGTSLNSIPKGTSLNSRPATKYKTKKKPPPKSKLIQNSISLNEPKGISLNEPLGTSLNVIKPSVSLKRTKRKPPPKKVKIVEKERKISNFRRKTASKKIQKFMKNHRSKIRLRFLNTVCTDSNQCIAFGKESNVIRKFFNDFDLKLLSDEPEIIGSESENATVQLLTFERGGYVANAIFKTSNKKSADNLAYEAIVGRFINKQKLKFPCFLETYGLYYNNYSNKSIYEYSKMVICKSNLIRSCKEPLSIGIMIENIKDGYTLGDYILDLNQNYYKDLVHFMNKDLLYILYQIYAPLSILSEVFTHYDLHANNVMLYPVGDYKHIEYHYHYDDHTVTFNSIYIVKIIDYSRCFFKDDLEYNPEKVYQDLCKSKDCNNCGKDSGFRWLSQDTKSPYINSKKRNMSQDLYLLSMLNDYEVYYNMDILNLIYSTEYKEKYGTPEIRGENDDKICNVNDARRHIEKLMENDLFKLDNDYYPEDKLGEMHIYSDGRPMIYKPV